jgi:flagellar hook protein FlgE
VDLSQEFAMMITTQKGFQANAKIVTVGDEMLLEAVSLKR